MLQDLTLTIIHDFKSSIIYFIYRNKIGSIKKKLLLNLFLFYLRFKHIISKERAGFTKTVDL